MKKQIKNILFAFIAVTILLPSLILPQEKGIEGNWLGSLNVSGNSLRIVFHITKTEEGIYKATMDSPDQGAMGIPVEKVTFADNKVKIEMPNIGGEYDGTLSTEGAKINGTWTQSGHSLPLNLERNEKSEVINRPQEPKPPFPYNSEDVSYINKVEGDTLAGTFTYPNEGSPFPAVVMITGSGPQNRNEEVFGHKPFLVISDYLTRHGIAVLRFDDRGVGKSTGDFKSATSKDFATDALAGVEYLKTRKEVNKKEIGLLGHSEGGMIAPMVAVESPDVAFIVLMAGPGLPGNQVLLKQQALIGKAEGESEKDIQKSYKINSKLFDIIKTEPDSIKAHEKLIKAIDEVYNNLTPEEQKKVGPKENMYKPLLKIESPWFRYFLRYDPRPTLEKVKCPVLAIDGSKDLQVPPKEDLAAIKEALTKGGNKNFETIELKGLNHLFQTCTTGAPSEYSKIEQTIAPIALKTIGDWILKITK